MKRDFMITLLFGLLATASCLAQTNLFPPSGNTGIGLLYPEVNLDIWHSSPQIRLLETNSGNKRRLQLAVGQFGSEITFFSSYGTGGNYPFVFRFGGGIQEVMRIATNGNVGIGTTTPQAKLAVNGNILTKEVKVKTDLSVPDYVFNPDYELTALDEIEAYVKKHKHLPEIPSAVDIERDGLNLARMNLLLLKNVEELTLHLIEREKKEKFMAEEIQELKAAVATLKTRR